MCVKTKGIIEGNRFQKIPTFLRNLCFEYDLKLELSVDSGWIKQTVRYTMIGPKHLINLAKSVINVAIKDNNL